MAQAIAAAGGVTALARGLKVSHQRVSKMRRCPKGLVFAMASASGVEAEAIRPDLAGWIEAERKRRWLDRARERFALSSGLGQGAATVVRADRPDPQTLDLLDLGLIVAAARFVAGRHGVTVAQVMAAPVAAGGAPTTAQAARSQAMALAVVVGRVNSATVAGLFGVSRQAADNAAERYLRARDGDGEDAGPDGRVIERGRVRRAKSADPALWEAQAAFVAQLAGDA